MLELIQVVAYSNDKKKILEKEPLPKIGFNSVMEVAKYLYLEEELDLKHCIDEHLVSEDWFEHGDDFFNETGYKYTKHYYFINNFQEIKDISLKTAMEIVDALYLIEEHTRKIKNEVYDVEKRFADDAYLDNIKYLIDIIKIKKNVLLRYGYSQTKTAEMMKGLYYNTNNFGR
ncbi:hypothetical protein [Brevibacillus laterosporus]|uniref:hypothetical protein n=1 Tax=Brevibacillus laterosporus TaxID=1465 RepID=UPI00215CBC5E|nr:hypothetical protein [Brevibacillus laterosporus]MCR8995228.1 hypothetical protein [Brevibacillus laterosporus]